MTETRKFPIRISRVVAPKAPEPPKAQETAKAQDTEEAALPPPSQPDEIGGPRGPEPTRYGDWERKGRCIDF
ncbi:MAG TPA: DUF1674 domain-containing protein [Acetobacteraceae bacterium]|nr:DUF1674 domain-containing protein [Acetobacteraceae bacterium]